MAYQQLDMAFEQPIEQMGLQELQSYVEWFGEVFSARMEIITAEVQSTLGYETWKSDFTPASLDSLGQWFYDRINSLPLRYKSVEEIHSAVQSWLATNVIPDVHGVTSEEVFEEFQTWTTQELGTDTEPERVAEVSIAWFHKNISPQEGYEQTEAMQAFENEWIMMTHGQILDPICLSIFSDIGMYFSEVFARYLKENYPKVRWHFAVGSLDYRHYHTHTHVIETNELMVNFNPIAAVTDIGFGIREGHKQANALMDLFTFWSDCIAIFKRQMPILAELADAGIHLKSIWDFRYEEDPKLRALFSTAVPILCKHLKDEHDPYVLEAITGALLEDELTSDVSPLVAMEVLEARADTLEPSLRRFLVMLALQGDETLQDKATKYL